MPLNHFFKMLNSKKLLLTGALFIGLSSYAQEDEDNTDGSKKIEAVVISKKKKKYKNPAHEILAKLVAKKHINNPDNLKYEGLQGFKKGDGRLQRQPRE